MAGQMLPVVFDPIAENPDATELDVNDGASGRSGYVVLADPAPQMDPPTPAVVYADSYSTEGGIPLDRDPKYPNVQRSFTVRVYGTDEDDLEANLAALYMKLGKFHREGGVLGWTTNAGTVCYFDVTPEATAPTTFGTSYLRHFRADVPVQLATRPFWRGEEVDLGVTSETTLPWLVLTELGPDGDALALARLIVNDDSGNDQWKCIFGIQSRYYDSDATAALAYQAEDLTLLGTSTDTAGAAGASSANVVRNTDLVPTWQGILKSEIDATNAALTHKGSFRVFVRLYRPTGNTGDVAVRLEWAEGDYRRPTANSIVTYLANDREGVFTWADLGLVHISPASDRWEFRLLAKSSVAGDEIDADAFLLFPTTEGYGEASALLVADNPSAFSDRDEFNQTAGALTGKTSAGGFTWAGAGDATDGNVETTDNTVERTAVSDADQNTGRYFISGVSAFADQVAQVEFKASSHTVGFGAVYHQGALARYVDTSNWLMATISRAFNTTSLVVRMRVAGTVSALGVLSVSPATAVWYTVRLLADGAGRWSVWLGDTRYPLGGPRLQGQNAALATGGALATGKPGFYDAWTSGSASTRNYNNFAAWVPATDAAAFANEAVQFTYESVIREDSTGAFAVPVSKFSGRYPRFPPAGLEGRSVRTLVKMFRHDPATMPDGGIDDLSAQLFVTPRGLSMPS